MDPAVAAGTVEQVALGLEEMETGQRVFQLFQIRVLGFFLASWGCLSLLSLFALNVKYRGGNGSAADGCSEKARRIVLCS